MNCLNPKPTQAYLTLGKMITQMLERRQTTTASCNICNNNAKEETVRRLQPDATYATIMPKVRLEGNISGKMKNTRVRVH